MNGYNEAVKKRDDPPPLSKNATTKEKMAHRLKTSDGKKQYKLRKGTVEPVFGIIKSVMVFYIFSAYDLIYREIGEIYLN